MRTSAALRKNNNPKQRVHSLIEIKSNLQGNNSRMDEARIISMIWNIKKEKQPIRTTRRKKNLKNEGGISNL